MHLVKEIHLVQGFKERLQCLELFILFPGDISPGQDLGAGILPLYMDKIRF